MGRVYTVSPRQPGELHGCGFRFFSATGDRLLGLSRVEFDSDADEGMARVKGCVIDATGRPIVNYETNQLCEYDARTWVRAVAPGVPDPAPTPGAVLIRDMDGSLKWFPDDPFPGVPEKVS